MNKKLNIHVLMHVPYEGLGCIEEWTNKHKHNVTYTRFYEQYSLPELETIDWLIIMGGPMGIYDEQVFTWLAEEKRYIKKAIESTKKVVGICLGSQLIADALGSKVFANTKKEIGWYPIKLSDQAAKHELLKSFDAEFTVFHWHGDTFNLPSNCSHLFYSDICKNQGFVFNNNVIGIQFHFEATENSLKAMVENGMDELVESDTVQSAKTILENKTHLKANNQKMFLILEYLAK